MAKSTQSSTPAAKSTKLGNQERKTLPVKAAGTKISATPKPRERKDGLRGKQVIFLAALAKKSPQTRKDLAEAALAHPTNVTSNALGDRSPEARAKREAKTGYPSLITLGHVRVKELTDDEKKVVVYEITPQGRKALEKALKEQAK